MYLEYIDFAASTSRTPISYMETPEFLAAVVEPGPDDEDEEDEEDDDDAGFEDEGPEEETGADSDDPPLDTDVKHSPVTPATGGRPR